MDYDAFVGKIDAGVFVPGNTLNENHFDPGQTWHTYRLEVRLNQIRLLVDNVLIAQGTDNTFQTCGTQVGLADGQIITQVSSFKVIAL